MSIIVYNKSLSKESCRNTKEKSRVKNKTWAPEKKPTNFLLPTKVASVPTITPEPVLHWQYSRASWWWDNNDSMSGQCWTNVLEVVIDTLFCSTHQARYMDTHVHITQERTKRRGGRGSKHNRWDEWSMVKNKGIVIQGILLVEANNKLLKRLAVQESGTGQDIQQRRKREEWWTDKKWGSGNKIHEKYSSQQNANLKTETIIEVMSILQRKAKTNWILVIPDQSISISISISSHSFDSRPACSLLFPRFPAPLSWCFHVWSVLWWLYAPNPYALLPLPNSVPQEPNSSSMTLLLSSSPTSSPISTISSCIPSCSSSCSSISEVEPDLERTAERGRDQPPASVPMDKELT